MTTATSERARVLIAEDHDDVRAGLCDLLGSDFAVVGAVADGETLITTAASTRPDVVVTDIAMPTLDGIAAAKRILHDMPGTQIVFVTVYVDPLLVRRGLDAGALGYVVKHEAGSDLVPAVHSVLRGEQYVALGIDTNPSHR